MCCPDGPCHLGGNLHNQAFWVQNWYGVEGSRLGRTSSVTMISIHTTASVLEETHTHTRETNWTWTTPSYGLLRRLVDMKILIILSSTSGNPEITTKKMCHPCHPPQRTSGITRQLRMKCQPAGMLQETWQVVTTDSTKSPTWSRYPPPWRMQWIGFWRSYFLVGYCKGVG